jgi:hypothetical protein
MMIPAAFVFYASEVKMVQYPADAYRVYTFSSLYLQVYIEPRRRWNTDNHLAMVIHG